MYFLKSAGRNLLTFYMVTPPIYVHREQPSDQHASFVAVYHATALNVISEWMLHSRLYATVRPFSFGQHLVHSVFNAQVS